jgi:large subunit ribosomal protein L3
LRRNNLPALRYLREFRTRDGNVDVEEGQELKADVFEQGELVDVIGISKGRGFAGTIKRHNFGRGPKTHGQSDRERAPGAIGMCATPGRTLKGQRMGGRMGNDRVTVQNLKVEVVDPNKNLLAVRGSVPGRKGGIVMIRQARKAPQSA